MTTKHLLSTTVIFATFLQVLYTQSIFYGNNFLCDTNNDCKPGDNIICDGNKDCIVDCYNGCNGIIINGKLANTLSITNCNECDDMTIYCPYNGVYQIDKTCKLELINNVYNMNIYAQESFNDFNIIQSKMTNYNILYSSIHCGDLYMIEFQCILSNNGNSCINTNDICQSYRIPTQSPTQSPTITKLPTYNNYTNLNTNLNTNLEHVTLFAETQSNNAHYIMLIVGLCIIWGSFFCCFLIMYYHREKKQQLNKAVNIMSRPISPSYHPSKSNNKLKLQLQTSQYTTQNSPQSKTHTEANQLYKDKSISNIIQVNLNNKKKELQDSKNHNDNKHVNVMIDVIPNSPNRLLSPRMDFIRSPRLTPRPYFYDKNHNGNITPYMSPRRGKLILNDIISNPMSINTVNTVNTAEAVEIKLPIEVKKIPCYDIIIEQQEKDEKKDEKINEKKEESKINQQKHVEKEKEKEEEEEEEEEIIKSHETPQFEDDIDDIDDIHLDVMHKNIDKDYEGSLDSRNYKQQVVVQVEDDDDDDDEEEEGDDNKQINALCRMNKMSVFWEYSEAPPPPPPTINTPTINTPTINSGNHSYMNSINSHSLNSPSRHYRVKYSLGIQQDIKNCMSVPGAVAEKKKFAFDDKSTENVLKHLHKHQISNSNSNSHSHSQYSLLKPPVSPCHSQSYHNNRYYMSNLPPVSHSGYHSNYYHQQQNVISVTPQPVSHLTYLAFPQSRPRIYSDPTFPAKQSL